MMYTLSLVNSTWVGPPGKMLVRRDQGCNAVRAICLSQPGVIPIPPEDTGIALMRKDEAVRHQLVMQNCVAIIADGVVVVDERDSAQRIVLHHGARLSEFVRLNPKLSQSAFNL